MPLEKGDEFAGFTVIRLLGAGGMGEVYLVSHPRLPRREALKVLGSKVSSDAEYRARFLREVDMAAALTHPQIVGVHDRGETEDGVLWVSMEYAGGIDAGRYLESNYPGGMPLVMVTEIALGIGAALDYAHSQGLLHRDVKPANILVSQMGEDQYRVMLTDFGIARRIDDKDRLTAANLTVGTVHYTSPEQLMAADLDGRSDQYSLAATVFHLLTGQPLFTESNPAAVIGSHLGVEPPPLSTFRPDLAELDVVLARGLAKEPDDRYRNCTAFARALAGLPEDSGSFQAASGHVLSPRPASSQSSSPILAAGPQASPTWPDEIDDEPADANATMMAPAAKRPRQAPQWALLAAVPLIVIATVVLVLYLTKAGPWAPEPAQPSADPAPAQPTSAEPSSVDPDDWSGVVAVVCDDEPCQLIQRNAPYAEAPALMPEPLDNGDVVELDCHVIGEEAANAGRRPSSLWYRMDNGAYVNSVFLRHIRATGMEAC